MVPRIAKSGHSFKGAALYYLHDKERKTTERVAWTYTHNIATNDPDKAFRYMAYTAKRADDLKRLSGVATTGRKRTAGVVYSFSIAWHPEQEPERNTMQNSALDILTELGLADHEAVFVCHTDTAHPHVHVIANLIHPETGRKAVPSYDYLTASKWAEELERKDGQIRCEQRVINNEKRRELAKDGRQLGMVKHREKPHEHAQKIQELYAQSDSAKAFQAALKSEGLTLAQGDRRGFVLVDHNGKISSLSRQLSNQRAKDIKARLAGLEHLPNGQKLADARKYFYRDDYETQRQKDIVDAAIDELKKPSIRNPWENTDKVQAQKRLQDNAEKDYDDSHLKKLDAIRAWEQKVNQARAKLEADQKAFYKRNEWVERIKALEAQLKEKTGFFSTLTGQRESLVHDLKTAQKTLKIIDQRITEQNQAFEKKALKSKPDFDSKPSGPDRHRPGPTNDRNTPKNRGPDQTQDFDRQ